MKTIAILLIGLPALPAAQASTLCDFEGVGGEVCREMEQRQREFDAATQRNSQRLKQESEMQRMQREIEEMRSQIRRCDDGSAC